MINATFIIIGLIFKFESIKAEDYAGKGIRSSSEKAWQFSSTPCYNTTLQVSDCGIKDNEINLDKAAPYKEFENKFKVDNGFKLKYNDLGIEFVNNHFKEFQEKDNEISLIYSSTVSKDYIYTLNFGEDFILPRGKYLLNKNQQNFLKICGDLVPEKFTVKASLIINVKIVLKDKETKEGFKIGMDLGLKYNAAAFKVTGFIEDMARQKNVQGTIKIHAKQIGGANPQKLSSIFKASEISECSIQKASECNSLIESMLEYAKNEFTNKEKCNEGSFYLSNIDSVQSQNVLDLI
jgi:hypothetical protein